MKTRKKKCVNIFIFLFFSGKKKKEKMSFFCLHCREPNRALLGKEMNSNLVFCRTKPNCQKSWYIGNEKDSLTEVAEVDAYIYLYLQPKDLISTRNTNQVAKDLISSVWFMKLYVKTWLRKLNEFGKPDIWDYRKKLMLQCGWNTPDHLRYIYHLFQVGIDPNNELFDMNVLETILRDDPLFVPMNLDYVQSVITRLAIDENKKLFKTFLSRVSPRFISRIAIEDLNLTPTWLRMIEILRTMQE